MKPQKNWRAIEQDGQVLYLQRICGQYYVMPEMSQWYAYFDPMGTAPFGGMPIGKHGLCEGALLICREHLHKNLTAQPVSNNEVSACGSAI